MLFNCGPPLRAINNCQVTNSVNLLVFSRSVDNLEDSGNISIKSNAILSNFLTGIKTGSFQIEWLLSLFT